MRDGANIAVLGHYNDLVLSAVLGPRRLDWLVVQFFVL